MAEAELLSSVTAGGMTIQSYSFRVSCEGDLVAEGQSSFGYFTEVVMAKQSGLVLPEESLSDAPSATTSEGNRSSLFDAAADHSRLSRQTHLDLVDRVELVERGGRFGRGLILGEKRLAGQEWFFENHFYQDPVMPGSLGLEAVIQGMWSLLMRTDTYRQTRIPVISFSNDAAFTWKYRGQVTPASRQLVYEVHIRQLNDAQDQVNLLCDAEFWVDGVRIYAFRDLRVGLEKGLHI
jgi:3-hydroxymyristoyl/3-hydroxydecanoyl-(acyl carrier protein) dehydratase